MRTIEAGGYEFEFADDVPLSQATQAIKTYLGVKENPKKADPNTPFMSFMVGALGKANEMGNNLRTIFDDNTKEEADQMEGARRVVDHHSAINPIATGAGELTTELATSFIGGSVGSKVAAPMIAPFKNKWVRIGLDNAAASVGGQIASGAAPDLFTTGADVALGTGLNAALPKTAGLLKALLRGKREGHIMEAAAKVGVTPSRGMLTDNPVTKTMEKSLENTWGSSGVMDAFNTKNQDAMQDFSDTIAKRIAGGNVMTPQDLAATIRQAYTDYLKKTSEAGRKYFTTAFQESARWRLKMPATKRAIQEMGRVVKDNPDGGALVMSNDLRTVMDALQTQSKTGMTLEGLHTARVTLQNMVDDLGSGIKTSDEAKVLRLMAGIDEDIQTALNHPNAFRVQGAYNTGMKDWAKRSADIKGLATVFRNQGDNELYRSVFGAGNTGVNGGLGIDSLMRVMNIMPEAVQKQMRAQLIVRAGRQAAGQAGDEGQMFSAAAFLTNWNKLDEDAAFKQLVAGDHYDDLAALALISDRMKALGRAANHSNTANHLNVKNIVGGAALMSTGGLSLLAIPMANISAKFLTNPDAVRAIRMLANVAESTPERFHAIFKLYMLAQQEPEYSQDAETILEAVGVERILGGI